jgi:hypothetical protein
MNGTSIIQAVPTLLGATTPASVPSVLVGLDGAKIYARKFSVIFEYATGWAPSVVPGGDWIPHAHLAHAWEHIRFSDLVVQKPSAGSCTFLILSKAWPDLAGLGATIATLLPQSAILVRALVLPAVLRLPLRPMDGATPPFPSQPCRCKRFHPRPHARPIERFIDGHRVELKVSVSHDGSGPVSSYAEAVLGWSHITRDGVPRSFLYVTDARRAPQLSAPTTLAHFLSMTLIDLVDFATDRHDLGLEVDPVRRLQLPAVATVKLVPSAGDFAFDVTLPTASGKMEFAAFPWPPWFSMARSPRVPAAIPPTP